MTDIFSLITRLERCQSLIEELKEAAKNGKGITVEKASSFRVGVINVERKLREVVVEVVGTLDDVGESE